MDPEEIKLRLRQRGLKQVDMARALGLDEIKVSNILKGKRQIKAAELDRLRELLDDSPRMRTLPVVGFVPGGNWREAIQQPLGFMPCPDPSIPPRAFALDVEGDSMDLIAPPGTRVIVDPEDKALFPNRFYVVMVDGETTFKQFKADPARLSPCSSNPAHAEIALGDSLPFEIVGRVIWRANPM